MIGLALRAVYAVIDRPKLAAVILAPLILGGVWWHGDRNGAGRERAAHEARTAALVAARTADARRIAGLAQALAAAQAERDEAAKELEDAARADPDAGRVALPADSVRRLRQR